MKFVAAILLSVVFHVGIFLLIVLFFNWFDEDIELAQLDLSAVELSFSENTDESPVISPVMPQQHQEAATKHETNVPDQPDEPNVKFQEELPQPPLDEREAQITELESDRLEADDFRAPKTEKIPSPVKRDDPIAPEKKEARPETPAINAANQARLDAQPRLKHSIQPRYPDSARKRGEQGTVVFEIVIDRKGRVESCLMIKSSGFGDLDKAAERAVRSAQFVPAKKNGKNVSSTRRIPVDFKLK